MVVFAVGLTLPPRDLVEVCWQRASAFSEEMSRRPFYLTTTSPPRRHFRPVHAYLGVGGVYFPPL